MVISLLSWKELCPAFHQKKQSHGESNIPATQPKQDKERKNRKQLASPSIHEHQRNTTVETLTYLSTKEEDIPERRYIEKGSPVVDPVPSTSQVAAALKSAQPVLQQG